VLSTPPVEPDEFVHQGVRRIVSEDSFESAYGTLGVVEKIVRVRTYHCSRVVDGVSETPHEIVLVVRVVPETRVSAPELRRRRSPVERR
jgi:hypothetical protein